MIKEEIRLLTIRPTSKKEYRIAEHFRDRVWEPTVRALKLRGRDSHPTSRVGIRVIESSAHKVYWAGLWPTGATLTICLTFRHDSDRAHALARLRAEFPSLNWRATSRPRKNINAAVAEAELSLPQLFNGSESDREQAVALKAFTLSVLDTCEDTGVPPNKRLKLAARVD